MFLLIFKDRFFCLFEVTFVKFQEILTSAICVTMLIASSSDQIYSRCVSGLKYFFCIKRGWGGSVKRLYKHLYYMYSNVSTLHIYVHIHIWHSTYNLYCAQLWLSSLTPFPWGSAFKGQLNFLEIKEIILIFV